MCAHHELQFVYYCCYSDPLHYEGHTIVIIDFFAIHERGCIDGLISIDCFESHGYIVFQQCCKEAIKMHCKFVNQFERMFIRC